MIQDLLEEPSSQQLDRLLATTGRVKSGSKAKRRRQLDAADEQTLALLAELDSPQVVNCGTRGESVADSPFSDQQAETLLLGQVDPIAEYPVFHSDARGSTELVPAQDGQGCLFGTPPSTSVAARELFAGFQPTPTVLTEVQPIIDVDEELTQKTCTTEPEETPEELREYTAAIMENTAAIMENAQPKDSEMLDAQSQENKRPSRRKTTKEEGGPTSYRNRILGLKGPPETDLMVRVTLPREYLRWAAQPAQPPLTHPCRHR